MGIHVNTDVFKNGVNELIIGSAESVIGVISGVEKCLEYKTAVLTTKTTG